MGLFTEDELSKNAKGGTELLKKRLEDMLPQQLVEGVQITCSRVRELDPNKIQILYLHDLPTDPESLKLQDAEYRKQFDAIVCVSNWQMQMYNAYLGIPYDEMTVIPNSIQPIEVPLDTKFKDIGKRPIKLIYHSTPHRGLEILYHAFDVLYKNYDVELDVYSSFKLYGWEERDKQYEELFQKLKDHPKINYHGTKSNDEVRDALAKADIFAFPSIWQETSCLCLIEAMSAGCMTVHSNLAALYETAQNSTIMYQYTEDAQKHLQRFADNLNFALSEFSNSDNVMKVQEWAWNCKSKADTIYHQDLAKAKWTALINDLKTENVFEIKK